MRAAWMRVADCLIKCNAHSRGKSELWKQHGVDARDIRCRVANRVTRVPRDFIVCFAFNPHQTKGIYASYDDKPSDTSMVGIPDAEEPKPFAKGNWLIRCKVEQRKEK
jgi:hypothetical protein